MWLVGSGKDTELPQQINFSQLNQIPFVNFCDEYPAFDKIIQNKVKETGVQLNTIFESSNVGTLKRVIESGLGWGFIPAHSIKKQVRSGRLSRTHVKDLHYEMDLMFYYPNKSEKKVLCETLYQTLSQQEKM